MPPQSNVRRLAMQLLYQIDLTGDTDRQQLAGAMDEEFDTESTRSGALDLALAAWENHSQADQQIAQLTPDWPTHRQPPVDRAILRLAHYEMQSGRAPVKVVINEAVELAKLYCASDSPAFINGVLDKLVRPLLQAGSAPVPPAPKEVDADQWLDDAMHDQ